MSGRSTDFDLPLFVLKYQKNKDLQIKSVNQVKVYRKSLMYNIDVSIKYNRRIVL